MTLQLPPSVLPLIPMTFAPGDRLTYVDVTHTRDASGRWRCADPGCTHTDEAVRRVFTSPEHLAMCGVPLYTPAHVPPGSPLPGRPVTDGQSPFEAGRPYLVCITGCNGPELAGVQTSQRGPWGRAQAAVLGTNFSQWGDQLELSLTDTGTVYLRIPSGLMTCAYVPADDPTDLEAIALVAHATTLAAALDRL